MCRGATPEQKQDASLLEPGSLAADGSHDPEAGFWTGQKRSDPARTYQPNAEATCGERSRTLLMILPRASDSPTSMAAARSAKPPSSSGRGC